MPTETNIDAAREAVRIANARASSARHSLEWIRVASPRSVRSLCQASHRAARAFKKADALLEEFVSAVKADLA